MTKRKILEYWTEVKRIVNGEVKQTACCCKDPGESRRDCMLKSGNKTPCRCFCHDTKKLK
jgi:hypothetical protein